MPVDSKNKQITITRAVNARWMLTTLAGVAFLTGCQSMLGRAPGQSRMAYQQQQDYADEAYGYADPVVAAPAPRVRQPQPVVSQRPDYAYQQAPLYNAQTQAMEAEHQELKRRLDRAEQALLRLDRRMQLVERNELGRMGSVMNPELSTTQAASLGQPQLVQTVRQALQTPTWQNEPEAASAMVADTAAAQPVYAEGFMPVSGALPDSTIRSTLQASPNRLPSLADAQTAATGRIPQSNNDLAIWTVRYEPDKVWPDRDQLPASRTVVEMLRKSDTISLVARGAKPNSPAFQERVRALSRYLAKVAALETVPISTLVAPQLDGDTIEILATP